MHKAIQLVNYATIIFIRITDLLITKYVQLENVQDGLVSTKDRTGMIPLHLACRNGETEIVEVHITKLKDSFDDGRPVAPVSGRHRARAAKLLGLNHTWVDRHYCSPAASQRYPDRCRR